MRLWPCGFFFQAEDGIRDGHVTGVQTCALPISGEGRRLREMIRVALGRSLPDPPAGGGIFMRVLRCCPGDRPRIGSARRCRSEERRVGKEWRGGRAREDGERTRRRMSIMAGADT